MNLLEQGLHLEEALMAYDFGGQVAGALRYGEGHINDSFAVYTQQPDGSAKRFLLQRINTHVFTQPDKLMENIIGVTRHLRKKIVANGGDPDRETLTVLPTLEGAPFFTDSGGGAWRAYLFIEGAISFQTATAELFHESARSYGRFVLLLEDYPAQTLHETIAQFHNTRQRFANFTAALGQDAMGRAASCKKEIDFLLAREKDTGVLMDLLEAGKLPLRVTHNDTKLNNILMAPYTLKGVCIVDLDTVMPGTALNDFGDSIRFGASTAAEDETDLDKVHFSLPLFETYTKGYLDVAGPVLTQTEKEMLAWGARLLTLECGMRFLTDYLEGDTYFRIHREGHNLDRARTQIKLVQEMEEQWQEMNAAVARYI